MSSNIKLQSSLQFNDQLVLQKTLSLNSIIKFKINFLFKTTVLFVLLGFILFSFTASADNEFSKIKYLPVQDGGRIKPFDTFARESLKLFYGRETYKTDQGKKVPAFEVITTMLIAPQVWMEAPLFQVRHAGLREALKFSDKMQVYHSAKELFANDRLPLLFQELSTLRNNKEKLNPYFQAIQTLENQLGLYEGLRTGAALKLAPQIVANVQSSETDELNPMEAMRKSVWVSVAELDGELKIAFTDLMMSFAKGIGSRVDGDSSKAAEVSKEISDKVQKVIELSKAQNSVAYANLNKIKYEVFYNEFHPYMWSWAFYLIGTILIVAGVFYAKNTLTNLGLTVTLIAFSISALGLLLRTYLTGRPPVSNMYETVVWVPWAGVLFAVILGWIRKNWTPLIAANLISVFCLILSDLSPTVLDDSLQPLEPVLRDNFWLVTHVLVIVASYGAFFLAFGLGLWVLGLYLKNETKHMESIKLSSLFIYRAIQIGLVLLTAGTILGGVWADYSWGRFWGWDPKETWAFIAIMGYLALLHARLTGLVRDFGTAVWSVVAFSLVIMAWYGVNFVLGAGLHTYGFGAGGVEYVASFVAIFLIYTLYVAAVRYKRLKK